MCKKKINIKFIISFIFYIFKYLSLYNFFFVVTKALNLDDVTREFNSGNFKKLRLITISENKRNSGKVSPDENVEGVDIQALNEQLRNDLNDLSPKQHGDVMLDETGNMRPFSNVAGLKKILGFFADIESKFKTELLKMLNAYQKIEEQESLKGIQDKHNLQKRYEFLKFIIENQEFMDYVISGKDTIEDFMNTGIELEQSGNTELKALYDLAITNPEFVKMLKDLGPDNVKKLQVFFKNYAKLDPKERTAIEGSFASVLKYMMYYGCTELLKEKFLYNEGCKNFQMLMSTQLNDMLASPKLLIKLFLDNEENRTCFQKLTEQEKAEINNLKNMLLLDENNVKELKENGGKKVKLCQLSFKKTMKTLQEADNEINAKRRSEKRKQM